MDIEVMNRMMVFVYAMAGLVGLILLINIWPWLHNRFFSRVRIDIIVPKTSFVPGETIRGTLELEVKKRTLIAELYVELSRSYPSKDIFQYGSTENYFEPKGGLQFLEKNKTLDAGKKYAYPFTFKIPHNVAAEYKRVKKEHVAWYNKTARPILHFLLVGNSVLAWELRSTLLTKTRKINKRFIQISER